MKVQMKRKTNLEVMRKEGEVSERNRGKGRCETEAGE